eukprot:5847887-Lingulodinium_polyedra.AAC.1
MSESSGLAAVGQRAQRYRRCAQRAFGHKGVQVVSVAMDVGRVCVRDILYAALYAPQVGVACWADLQ